jgi:small subunit ribosomal protein S6
MTTQYETVFIVTPVLSEEQMKEAVDKFRKFLKDKGAEIVFEEDWGLKKLAYPIQKKSTGFYHLFEYKADTELINELEVTFKRDERIMRFLTIKLDKHSIAYNEKKRQKAKEKKEEKAVETK